MNRHEIAEQLRQLSRLHVNSQKYRNKYANMLMSKVDYLEGDEDEWKLYFKGEVSKNFDIEKELNKKMAELLPEHPWSEYLLNIKGLGTRIAASIIGEIDGARFGVIEKDSTEKPELLGYGREFEKTSKLWAYSGYAVKDGKAQSPTSGEASNWNRYLKLTLFLLGDNFIKQRTPVYREIYDDRKAYEMERNPEMKKLHAHRRAIRYTIKKFLSDFYHDCMGN